MYERVCKAGVVVNGDRREACGQGALEDSRDGAADATACARWLLDAAREGAELTQTFALSRALVRDAAERWPGWWNAELFGPPHREAELPTVESLHDGLRRLKLVRRRGRKLFTTPLGRELASRPAVLLNLMAADLGRAQEFTEAVAGRVVATLAEQGPCERDDLFRHVAVNVHAEGWRRRDGGSLDERELSDVVMDVLFRGEAYGVLERIDGEGIGPRILRQRIALTDAGAIALGVRPAAGDGI